MTDPDGQDPQRRSRPAGFSRRRFVQGAAGSMAALYGAGLLGRPAGAQAAGSNPITVENAKAGTPAFQLDAGKYNGAIGGYTNKVSIDKGEALSVKLNSYDYQPGAPGTTAVLEVYRLGYYGGAGGRKVWTSPTVRLDDQGYVPAFDKFGYVSADATWTRSEAIDTSGFETGMYLIKVIAATGRQTHIPFVVRDDSRPRDVLVLLPTNTWQAYNPWPGKCLYVQPSYSDGVETVAGADSSGHSRAVKVSFDRQHNNVLDDLNWVLRSEFPLIHWLERQGYDVTYTEDTAFDAASAADLTPARTKVLAIAGHAEYWTQEMFQKTKAARDAGTHIASFSANAAYWKVRYEDNRRTLVCFKTVQGRNADAADLGKDGVNDFGPGATTRGGVNDPLGPGGQQGGGDDKPQFATTTFRDAGAAPGSANAPDNLPAPARNFEGAGRVGPDSPENELWGVLYVGDHDVVSYPLQVPAGNGNGGEFGAHRAWRHTTLADGSGSDIGNDLVGWEWDSVPQGNPSDPTHVYARYLAKQPAGVKRLSQTNVRALATGNPAAASLGYLLDEGRSYRHGSPSSPAQPPAGMDGTTQSVIYTAPSGALVFSAGTIQWSFGLAPHFDSAPADKSYESPRVDSSQPVIAQATYNILVDMGVKPATPDGVVLDVDPVPPGSPPPPAVAPTSGPPKTSTPDRTPPKLSVKGGTRRVKKGGIVKVRATAPTSEREPFGAKLVLHVEVPRAPRKGKKRPPLKVKLATRNTTFVGGQSKVISFRLPERYRRMLATKRAMRMVLETRATDPAGNTIKRKLSFRLLATPK